MIQRQKVKKALVAVVTLLIGASVWTSEVLEVDVDVGAVKHLMQKDEEPVRSLAAVAQELNAMAEGRHFDFERMNSIMAEMAHAKVCLERNRERRCRCNSRTPGSTQ